MRRLDFNRDGEITVDEIYNALRPFDTGSSSSIPNIASRYNSGQRSPVGFGSEKVSFKQKELERISVDEIIN